MLSRLKKTAILGGLLLWWAADASAQCAMCRATIENNLSSGEDSFGAGLNTGILYLMSFPYITIAVLAFLWWRNSSRYTAQRLRIASMLKGKVPLR